MPGARSGFVSDYNVLENRFSTDGGNSVIDIDDWRALGYDTHSVIATPAQLFVTPSTDVHLKAGSPAIDAGRTIPSVTRDRDGNPRPQGARSDAGTYESDGTPPKPSCTLSPTTAIVGQRLSLSCRYFDAGEQVRMTWDGVAIGGFTVDGDGAGRATVIVPRTPKGTHSVRSIGESSGKTNTKRVTVTPSLSLSPRSAAPGATVKVTLRGFAAGETVALRFRTAPQSSRTVASGIVTSTTGTASASFRVPAGAAGRYTVEATGTTSSFASALFTRLEATITGDPSPTATPTPAAPTETASPEPTPTEEPPPTETPVPETATPESQSTPTLEGTADDEEPNADSSAMEPQDV